MKRDMDIIRAIMINLETGEDVPELEAAKQEDILYNIVLLQDAGLIDAHFTPGNGILPHAVHNIRLTWSGHEFLDASRDSKLWKLAKEHVLKPGVSWTFSILFEWLKQEAKKHLLGNAVIGSDPTELPPNIA